MPDSKIISESEKTKDFMYNTKWKYLDLNLVNHLRYLPVHYGVILCYIIYDFFKVNLMLKITFWVMLVPLVSLKNIFGLGQYFLL